jgi:hypothetical protein
MSVIIATNADIAPLREHLVFVMIPCIIGLRSNVLCIIQGVNFYRDNFVLQTQWIIIVVGLVLVILLELRVFALTQNIVLLMIAALVGLPPLPQQMEMELVFQVIVPNAVTEVIVIRLVLAVFVMTRCIIGRVKNAPCLILVRNLLLVSVALPVLRIIIVLGWVLVILPELLASVMIRCTVCLLSVVNFGIRILATLPYLPFPQVLAPLRFGRSLQHVFLPRFQPLFQPSAFPQHWIQLYFLHFCPL